MPNIEEINAAKTLSALEGVVALRARLWQAGLRPVALYSANTTHSDGGDEIPLQSRGKRPQGSKWHERARYDPPQAAVRTPHANALNTGILCDGHRVVDIDIENRALAEQVAALAVAMFGATIVRTRANSPRCALIYRAAEGQPVKREILGAAGKIEVLGYGQQLHAFGPHYTGVDLEWCPEPPDARGRDGLPAVTEEQVTAFLTAAASVIDAPTYANRSVTTTVVDGSPLLGPRPQFKWREDLPDMNAAAQAGIHWFALLKPDQMNELVRQIFSLANVAALTNAPRAVWLKLLWGAAHAEVLGATEARQIALDWSRPGRTFKEPEFDKAWNSFREDRT